MRYRSSYGDETNGTYIAATRLTVDYVHANPITMEEKDGARVQVVYEDNTTQGISSHALRFGELYGFDRFRFPGVTANVEVGQFVIPFGLAAAYDSSMLPIHSLYDKSLGLRIDVGTMLEGEYGLYHYAGSVTDGSGPNRRDFNNGRITSFRLERTLVTDLGKFEIGGSLLSGRGPVTDFSTELPPSGTSSARQFVDITRFGGDAQYWLGRLIARGEVIAGADNEQSVWGYFAEADYNVFGRVQAVLYNRTWNFPIKPEQYSSSGIGANYLLGRGLVLRGLYEYERDSPLPAGTLPIVIRRFTIQTNIGF